MNINMSAKHVFRVHTKMINILRATVMLALWRLGRLGITACLLRYLSFKKYVIKAVQVVLEQFKLAK